LPASTHLNPFTAGIIMASIIAAIMSAADSQLLVTASGVGRDIYQKIIAKEQALN